MIKKVFYEVKKPENSDDNVSNLFNLTILCHHLDLSSAVNCSPGNKTSILIHLSVCCEDAMPSNIIANHLWQVKPHLYKGDWTSLDDWGNFKMHL